jgi:hypothetical protein
MNSQKILSQALLSILVTTIPLISLPSENLVAQVQKNIQQPPSNNSPSSDSKTPWVINSILKWLRPHRRSGGSTDRLTFRRIVISQSSLGSSETSITIEDRVRRGYNQRKRQTARETETESVTIYGQDSICMLSPIFNSNAVHRLWTRQPLIVWAGYSSAFQLVDTQSKKIVWQKKVGKESGRIKIDVPLESGKSYTLKSFSFGNPETVKVEATFQTVTATEWSQINKDLLSIEQISIAQGKIYKEVALEKATYFAKNQLWGDVEITILSNWQDEKEGKEINVINSVNLFSSDDKIQTLLTEIQNTFPIACKLDQR